VFHAGRFSAIEAPRKPCVVAPAFQGTPTIFNNTRVLLPDPSSYVTAGQSRRYADIDNAHFQGHLSPLSPYWLHWRQVDTLPRLGSDDEITDYILSRSRPGPVPMVPSTFARRNLAHGPTNRMFGTHGIRWAALRLELWYLDARLAKNCGIWRMMIAYCLVMHPRPTLLRQ
jgi:hypothetical protein